MFLPLATFLLCCLSVRSSLLGNVLIYFTFRPETNERQLFAQRRQLKQAQSQLSVTNDFSAHAKLQRRINAIDNELVVLGTVRQQKAFKVKLFFDYSLRVGVNLLLAYLVYSYKSVPVMSLSEKYDFFPLNSLVTYPCGEGVSLPFWVMCCMVAARRINHEFGRH